MTIRIEITDVTKEDSKALVNLAKYLLECAGKDDSNTLVDLSKHLLKSAGHEMVEVKPPTFNEKQEKLRDGVLKLMEEDFSNPIKDQKLPKFESGHQELPLAKVTEENAHLLSDNNLLYLDGRPHEPIFDKETKKFEKNTEVIKRQEAKKRKEEKLIAEMEKAKTALDIVQENAKSMGEFTEKVVKHIGGYEHSVASIPAPPNEPINFNTFMVKITGLCSTGKIRDIDILNIVRSHGLTKTHDLQGNPEILIKVNADLDKFMGDVK